MRLTKFIGGSALAAVSSADPWIAGVDISNTLSLAQYNGSGWSIATAPSGIGAPAGGTALSSGAVWFPGGDAESNGSTAPAVLSTTTG